MKKTVGCSTNSGSIAVTTVANNSSARNRTVRIASKCLLRSGIYWHHCRKFVYTDLYVGRLPIDRRNRFDVKFLIFFRFLPEVRRRQHSIIGSTFTAYIKWGLYCFHRNMDGTSNLHGLHVCFPKSHGLNLILTFSLTLSSNDRKASVLSLTRGRSPKSCNWNSVFFWGGEWHSKNVKLILDGALNSESTKTGNLPDVELENFFDEIDLDSAIAHTSTM
jgi:hypothetical protein